MAVLLIEAPCGRRAEHVGANTAAELRSPRPVPGNNLIVPGRCSLDSDGIKFATHPSDS
jgi:hypothetical protein